MMIDYEAVEAMTSNIHKFHRNTGLPTCDKAQIIATKAEEADHYHTIALYQRLPPPLPPDTFSALYLPFRSSQTLSNVTESPCWQFSSSGLSLTCAKQSSPPSSGSMKPKPLSWKNFFTVPFVDMVKHDKNLSRYDQ